MRYIAQLADNICADLLRAMLYDVIEASIITNAPPAMIDVWLAQQRRKLNTSQFQYRLIFFSLNANR